MLQLSLLQTLFSFLKSQIENHFRSITLNHTSENPYLCNLTINPSETQGLSELEKWHITALFCEDDTLYFVDEFNQKYELMQLDIETLLDLLTQN